MKLSVIVGQERQRVIYDEQNQHQVQTQSHMIRFEDELARKMKQACRIGKNGVQRARNQEPSKNVEISKELQIWGNGGRWGTRG
ncbi:hypothetical protein V6N12_074343 [Hibiscus sabdariffa]